MSARNHWEADAGDWVAYRDEPRRERDTRPGLSRFYLWDVDRGTGSSDPRDCVRFNTKAEALAAARARWPVRVQGCRIGAERVPPQREAKA